jgi:RIO kinase 1
MGTGLEHLLAEGVVSEVLARLQSGKEAEVYVVRFGGKIVAAKVYKDRATRSFKNNAVYKEGRSVRNSRSARAIASGSRFGKAAAEDAWKSAEANALYKLHDAEVRVPTPVLYIDGVLLMELVLDANGNPARRLIDTGLTVSQANEAYHDMLRQLVRILACDLIHGDLSPYNVLWAAAGPTVIDFPQIVSASHNSSSERFFRRDAENILGHFASIDRSLLARRSDVGEIWRAYVRRELTPEFVPTGKHQPEPRGGHAPRPAPAGTPSYSMRTPQDPRGRAPARHDNRRDAPGTPRLEGSASTRPAQQQRQPPRSTHGTGAPRRPAHGPEVIVLPRRSFIVTPAGASPASPPPAQVQTQSSDRTESNAERTDRPAHRRRRRRR